LYLLPSLFFHGYVDRPFPEIVWRQQDPSCLAIDADVVDTSSPDDYMSATNETPIRPISAPGGLGGMNAGNSIHDVRSASAPSYGAGDEMFGLNVAYVVLCRVHTGLSSLHSVQIGQLDHSPIRLEV
jgi:hypothetical protein